MTPATLLVDVLKEATQKRGLDMETHCFKHNGGLVDLTLSFRLSGLSNNAEVDIVPAGPPKDVICAISLASVGTFRSTFKSDATLWSIFEYFQAQGSVPSDYGYATDSLARHPPPPLPPPGCRIC